MPAPTPTYKQINTRLILRHDTVTNWTLTSQDTEPGANDAIILSEGEVAISLDDDSSSAGYGKCSIKVGNGTDVWTALPFIAVNISDVIGLQTALNGLQTKITASGLLKGNGTGGVTAAVAGTDYVAPQTTLSGYGITDAKIDSGVITLGANTIKPATLGQDGKVPSSQLPSYVDDVVEGYYNAADGKFYEESTYTTEIPGEDGKIYVSLDTNKTYRWSGSAFVVISETLALGETSSTAYRGDRGKAAYDHATDSGRLTTAATSKLYKVAVTAEGHISSVTEAQASDIPGLSDKASKVTGADQGDIVVFDANGDIASGGQTPAELVAGKADKVTGSNLNDKLAALDANGNLKSSGKTVADFVQDVTVNGVSVVENGTAEVLVPVSGSGDNSVQVDNGEMYVESVTTDIIVNGSLPLVIDGGNAFSPGNL